jgi:hypothetical protein
MQHDGPFREAVSLLLLLCTLRVSAAAEAVAKRRRMPAGMGFSFFVESSFVELHNEQCHDLYAKGAASSLPVRAQHVCMSAGRQCLQQ